MKAERIGIIKQGGLKKEEEPKDLIENVIEVAKVKNVAKLKNVAEPKNVAIVEKPADAARDVKNKYN